MYVRWHRFFINRQGLPIRVMRVLCVILLNALLVVSYSQAQESPDLDVIRPYFEASNLVPLIGEPFTVAVIVELPSGSDLVEFPTFQDLWGVFEIIARSPIDESLLENNWTQYRQTLDVIVWETGDFETPETLVGYLPANEAEIFYAPFNTLYFTVPSVLDPDMNRNELRPLKPQIAYFELPLWIIIGGCFVVMSGVNLFYRWRKRRNVKYIIPPAKPTSAEVALEQLRHLRDDVKRADFRQNDFYERLSEILRMFVINKFRTASRDLTTSEFLTDLRRNTHLDERLVGYLESVLIITDDVKFGGDTLDHDLEKLLNDCARWVNTADEMIGEEDSVVKEMG